MTRTLSWMVLLAACGAAEPAAEPPGAEEPPTSEPSETPTEPSDTPTEPEDERARILREAEAFVRAQGYTDTPPTVSGDAIVNEGIEGTLEDRRGMLEPRAVRAVRQQGAWTVLFAYRSPEYAGRGRALVIPDGEAPHFVHQDVILEAWTDRVLRISP